MGRLARRGFGVALTLALLVAASAASSPAGLARSQTSTTVAGIDVDQATIPELQAFMDLHRLNSVQLTQFYLQRITKLNPALNAVITVSPTAVAEARAADAGRRTGDDRPLLGIPIIVKDNIDTAGMDTTAGSWALAGSQPDDAFVIEQLKAAGALIIGKANLSEWANWRSDPSSSGWSGVGGQTNMAYVLNRNPCGSSSGSGVVASADLAVAAVGTETDGSIVCPSGANGVVGIKPTLGLVSRAGIVPISANQDTSGPIARNVTDAAVLLGAMTGVDPDDPATTGQVAESDYTVYLDEGALDGARIGVWVEGTYDPSAVPEVTPILEETIAALEDAGATVVPADISISGDTGLAEFLALLCESKDDITAYLHTYAPDFPDGYTNDLEGLLAFNEDHPELESPDPGNWNNALWDLALATDGRDSQCAGHRADATPVVQDTIDGLLEGLQLDAIIALTNGPAWVTDPEFGDFAATDEFTTFVGSSNAAAISGYADITVPAGHVGPLPVGITFIGGKWDEPTLIGLAYAFEQATQVRTPPQFLPTWSGESELAPPDSSRGRNPLLQPLR
jgi:amidase